MKKVFKIVYVIISIISLAGCLFFGYFYFKDFFKKKPDKMTFATAREMVYTAAYDFGIISEASFQLDLNKEPLPKAANATHVGEYNVEFDQLSSLDYKPYTTDNVYLATFEYSHSPFEHYPAIFGFEYLTQFFMKDNLKEDNYYKFASDSRERIYSYEIVSDSVLKVYEYSPVAYGYTDTSTWEIVYVFEVLNKTDAGITDYTLTAYTNSDNWSADKTYYNIASVAKIDVRTTNNVKKLERYSYAFGTVNDLVISSGIKSVYFLDVDIVNDKILLADTAEISNSDLTKVSINNRLHKAVTANTREDRRTYYAGVEVNILN